MELLQDAVAHLGVVRVDGTVADIALEAERLLLRTGDAEVLMS